MTKYASMVDKAEDIRYKLERAIHEATTGRPGPTLLDIPINVQKQDIDVDKLSYDISDINDVI